MELTNLATKLQMSRLRLLENHPFYGLLLLNMKFSLDINGRTAYTNGDRIAFDPEFLDELSDKEIDYVLMHEVLHTALGHVWRGKDYEDKEAFNFAADIIVNSNILYSNNGDLSSITLKESGEAMHLTPDGYEGYNYSAEEIYPVLSSWLSKDKKNYDDLTSKGHKNYGKLGNNQDENGNESSGTWDNHDEWKENSLSDDQRNEWLKRMIDATDLIATLKENTDIKTNGKIPAFMEVILKELKKSRLDWKTILQNFIQEDIVDYSFMPPDRRFDESAFFLPDFNEKDDSVKNILFMIDTSGSMTDEMITEAFSEIKGAIDQFDGKLSGKLGFFDAQVYKPVDFDDVDDLLKIRPRGRGGTDFLPVFNYVNYAMDEEPAEIIIMTDGYAPIPDEKMSNGIPVLWLINNEEVTPEWGKIARMK